jgi:hypothetical protein
MTLLIIRKNWIVNKGLPWVTSDQREAQRRVRSTFDNGQCRLEPKVT